MSKNQQGVALMMVLWVLLLLSFIALEFAHSMRTEVEVTKNFRDEIQAYYLARAGVELGRYELAISGKLKPHYRDPESQRVVFGKGEGGECKKSPECRVFELGNGISDYRFLALGDKYPLNKLADKKNEAPLNTFLAEYCGLEAFSEEISMIAHSIRDWVDSDDFYSLPGIGAEDDWYKSNDKGYECKDADFDSTDELSLIRGLRIEDGDSEEEIAGKNKMIATFKKYFCVYPENVHPQKSLFMNTASQEIIQMAYKCGLIKELPETIETKKEENCGIYDNFGPNYYYIISTAVMKSSPVQRGIKASFFRRASTYWKPMYWNDNYIPEYDDPNQMEDFVQDDQTEE